MQKSLAVAKLQQHISPSLTKRKKEFLLIHLLGILALLLLTDAPSPPF